MSKRILTEEECKEVVIALMSSGPRGKELAIKAAHTMGHALAAQALLRYVSILDDLSHTSMDLMSKMIKGVNAIADSVSSAIPESPGKTEVLKEIRANLKMSVKQVYETTDSLASMRAKIFKSLGQIGLSLDQPSAG